MDVEIRPATLADAPAIFAIRAQAFRVPRDDYEPWLGRVDLDRHLVACVGDDVVGGLVVHPLAQWFGGRSVRAGGVASVAVRPEHRGQGIGARLLRSALAVMSERDEVLSALHPATTSLYRRHGWEIAGDHARFRVDTGMLARLPRGEPDRLRLATPEDLPLLRACYDAVAPLHPGWLDRPDRWWERIVATTFDEPHGYAYLVEDDERGAAGYLRYRLRPTPDGWGHRITVDELVARDPLAAVTLLQVLASSSAQVEVVTFVGGSIDALHLALPEQRLRAGRNNRWMLRLVDVGRALSARGYPEAVRAEVHLELVDREVTTNEGRFVLTIADGRGELRPGGTGELRMTVNGLAALYSGWASTATIADAGMLHGPRSSARTALDAAFAGRRPSILDDF